MPTIQASNLTDLAFLDLVNNLQIESNFRISHPQYEPTETPEDIVAKLQQMPAEVQHKYLTLQLRSFLQGIYCQGDWHKIDAPTEEKIENKKNLESNLFSELEKNNCSRGYLDDGWLVTGRENDWLVVYKDELTLHLPSDRYFPSEYQNSQQGDIIPIKCPANLIEYGYYVAVGNAGTAYNQHPDRTVNIYFNFDVEAALIFTKLLTQELNEIELSFTFKALYNPAEYQRYDSGVLNICQHQYPQVKAILETIYSEYKPHFAPSIPLFTKLLAPGVGLAEELPAKDSPEDGFGKHRCQIISAALIDAWQDRQDSPEQRIKFIERHFAEEDIDLNVPYLSFSSKDNYQAFNL